MIKIKPSALRALRMSVLGHFDEIVEATGKSKTLVSMVLKGKRHNNEIIDKAIEIKERISRENAVRESRILSKESAA
jgi:hypothetical protein